MGWTDFVISAFAVVTICSSELGLGHCKRLEELGAEGEQENFLLEPLVMADANVPYHFSCSISTDKSSYTSSEEVRLTFDLTSHSERDLYVLEWNTPLEGMHNRYLRVFVGGEEEEGGREIQYRGIMAKRGSPSAESYVLVGAGKTVSASVSLQKGYDTTAVGKYSVELKAKLFDVEPRREGVEFQGNPLGEMTPVPISCGPIHFTVEPSAF